MKVAKRVFGVLLLAAVPLLAWAGLTHAQRFTNSVDKGEVVNSSLYSTGKNVDIKGEVFGDVFCAGQNVRIDAVVHGDVLCAGMDVTVAGTVDGDIRAAGRNVSIAAKVGKSATLAGSDVSIDADATIGQDLTVGGSTANVKGVVGRDISAGSSQLTLNGKVGRNVRATGSSISLKSGADILGNFSYTSDKEAHEDPDAIVSGETKHTTPERKRGYNFDVRAYLFLVGSMVLAAVALAAIFPQFLQRTSGRIKKGFFKALAVGILGGLAIPAAMVGLAFLFVGIPLAIMLLVAALLATMLSAPIAAYYVGRLVLKGNMQPMVVGALGALVLTTAYFVPWVGFVFVLLGFWLGLGALLLELKAFVGRSNADAEPTGSTGKAKAKKA